ncbi:MAG: tetratricopeptide repeat protein [Selenomonadaceae bacterium]|nr:tetratricopeptide repeat protein [Selenomonadaceae bacterium]
MDFEKIFAEFKVADAKNDFEKMSDIFAQVHEYCCNLVRAGKADEIPPNAYYIGSHVDVFIYQAVKFLNDNRNDKAISYLMLLFKSEPQTFEKFFNLLYILGRSFYELNDYPNAIKIFEHYEHIRALKLNDVDELSLFYRANCFALIRNFKAAIKIYEQILKIKSDFPEVKQNLKLAKRGSNKNLVRKLSSLWNFPYWQDVPIFINARDRLGVMKKLIDWLLDAGYRKLIILDNDSTYPQLLNYYSELEKDSRLKIIRFKKNFGYKALWLSGVLEKLKIMTPYVYTDPDVLPIEDCPKDFVKQLMKILDSNHEIRKVGLGLVWEDITFFDKDRIQNFESNFYNGSRVGENLYSAQVDTTFALYSNVRHYSLRFSLRTTGELRAYHLPWYLDYNNLPDDEKYYTIHADKNSVTTVKKSL